MSGYADRLETQHDYPSSAATGHSIEIPAQLQSKLKASELRKLEETCAQKENLSRKVIVKVRGQKQMRAVRPHRCSSIKTITHILFYLQIMHAMEGGKSFDEAHSEALKETAS